MKKVIAFAWLLFSIVAAAQPTPWVSVGPAPQVTSTSGTVSGRVNAIVVRPTFTDNGINKIAMMFIAPEGGGLWRSTDFESPNPIWTPVLDNFFPDAQNIWSLAVFHNDPREVLAGGDNGWLFRSHDGGFSWEKIATGASTDYRGAITRIVLHPVTDQIYFATKYTNDVPGSYLLGGVYEQVSTTNSFARVNNGLPNTTTIITDMDYTSNSQGLSLYLGTAPNTGNESADVRGIWRWTESTRTWEHMNISLSSDLATGNTVPNGNIAFVRFACDHHFGSALGIYTAVVDQATMNLINVYKLVNNVWTVTGTPIASLNSTYSCAATLTMCMSSTGEVYLGCGNVPQHSVFQSTDGGGHWSSIRNGTNGLTPHNDERTLYTFNGKVYLGNDGGINRFNPLPSFQAGRSTWESLNTPSISTIEVNGLGIHPTDPDVMLCGSQDNAVALHKNGSWTEVFGGDGSRAIFDPVDPSHLYTTTESKYDFFYRSDDGGTTWNDKGPADAKAGPGQQAAGIGQYAPFDIHPNDPKRFVVGIDRVYETKDRGENWGKQKSPLFFPSGTRDDGRPFGSPATAVAFGGGERIWVAYGNNIRMTDNDGGDGSASNWSDLTATGGFGGNIVSICINPARPDAVYLGVDNGSVWRSAKNGATWTWTNLSGTKLTSMRLNTLYMLKPSPSTPILFAGTKRGVYYSADGGVNWWPYSNGMPPGDVKGIDYQFKTNTMIAGIYGRGVYKLVNPLLQRFTNLPAIRVNIPINDCKIPPIEGTTIVLSFTLTDPGEPGPFETHWTIDGASPSAGETLNNPKCSIDIPIPSAPITATVELRYPDGIVITATRTFATVSQQVASFQSFFCKYRKDMLKPIPWWEWDPEKWRLDKKTNTMVSLPFSEKEIKLIIRNLQVNLQRLQGQLKTNGQ